MNPTPTKELLKNIEEERDTVLLHCRSCKSEASHCPECSEVFNDFLSQIATAERKAGREEAIDDYQTNYEQQHIVSAIKIAREEMVEEILNRFDDPSVADHKITINLQDLKMFLADIKSKLNK